MSSPRIPKKVTLQLFIRCLVRIEHADQQAMVKHIVQKEEVSGIWDEVAKYIDETLVYRRGG